MTVEIHFIEQTFPKTWIVMIEELLPFFFEDFVSLFDFALMYLMY